MHEFYIHDVQIVTKFLGMGDSENVRLWVPCFELRGYICSLKFSISMYLMEDDSYGLIFDGNSSKYNLKVSRVAVTVAVSLFATHLCQRCIKSEIGH